MKKLNKRELLSLQKEIKDEIIKIRERIREEEKRDEFSTKVDRLYDFLEGNELLLNAVKMILSEIINNQVEEEEWEEFEEAIDFSIRNKATFDKDEIKNRVLI